jgi:iron complex transport system substrate-binding protein
MRYGVVCFILLVFSMQSFAAINLPQADGSSLKLVAPADRLITLSPHLAELVFAAGAGQNLVATVEYSRYPEAAASVPRIGDAFAIDVERVLALSPDLVIAWDSGNPRQAVSQLVSLGIPVWSVEIREPIEIAEVIKAIGDISGRTQQLSRSCGKRPPHRGRVRDRCGTRAGALTRSGDCLGFG